MFVNGELERLSTGQGNWKERYIRKQKPNNVTQSEIIIILVQSPQAEKLT